MFGNFFGYTIAVLIYVAYVFVVVPLMTLIGLLAIIGVGLYYALFGKVMEG
jgi:hypothetical protein